MSSRTSLGLEPFWNQSKANLRFSTRLEDPVRLSSLGARGSTGFTSVVSIVVISKSQEQVHEIMAEKMSNFQPKKRKRVCRLDFKFQRTFMGQNFRQIAPKSSWVQFSRSWYQEIMAKMSNFPPKEKKRVRRSISNFSGTFFWAKMSSNCPKTSEFVQQTLSKPLLDLAALVLRI